MTCILTIHLNIPNDVFQRYYFSKFNPEGKITENNIFNMS